MSWTGIKGDTAAKPDASANGHSPGDAPPPIGAPGAFRDHLLAGAKPRAEWRVGAELELIGYEAATHRRLDHHQIRSVIENLAPDAGEHTFDGAVFAGAHQLNGGELTVEPGGQLEYSSAPYSGLAEIEREFKDYLRRLHDVAGPLGYQFLAIGFDPLRTIDEQHWFPKPRYEIMRPYMGSRGTRAWDMMTRTGAVQISLDFDSAADLIRKFVIGNQLAPFVAAMFANSPFADGRPTGYKSTRGLTWLETDPDRCGIPEVTRTAALSVDGFVEYALDVPLLFRRREGGYLGDFTGSTFREYLRTVTLAPDEMVADWADHLTTIFTEVRLKQYLEFRSADCGSLPMAMAAQALWKGLLYDRESLEEAVRLMRDLAPVKMRELQLAVARDGLQAKYGDLAVLETAQELVRSATAGLRRLAPDEVHYLDILHQQVVEEEICPADILLRNWEGSWQGSMERVFAAVGIA